MKKLIILFIVAVMLQVAIVLYVPLSFLALVYDNQQIAEFIFNMVYFGLFTLLVIWLVKKYREIE